MSLACSCFCWKLIATDKWFHNCTDDDDNDDDDDDDDADDADNDDDGKDK